jgi:putative transcriptional regulator
MKTPIEIISGMTATLEYSPEAIKQLMARLNLNEKGFAVLMNVLPITIRMWTSGAAQPCGQSARLMQIYEACPEIVGHIIGNDSDD